MGVLSRSSAVNGLGRAALLLARLVLVANPAVAESRYRLRLGDPLPELALPPLDGGARVTLRGLLGRPLVFSFYSRYCAPCRRELPTLARVIARVNRGLVSRRHVVPVVISVDARVERKEQKEFGRALRWLLDPEGRARALFDPRTYPCTFLIDAGGVVRHINRGFGSGYEQRVERWLRRMVAGAEAGP